MQGDAHGVDLSGVSNPGQKLVEHPVIRSTLDRAGRVRGGREARNDLDPEPLGRVDHAAEVGSHPPVLLDDLVSVLPVLPLKLRDRRRRPEHRVRLVHDLTDGYAHGVVLPVPAERSSPALPNATI